LKKVKNALISVFYKEGLDQVLEVLNQFDINFYSTGGTYDYIKEKGYNAQTIESLTSYPSILGGDFIPIYFRRKGKNTPP